MHKHTPEAHARPALTLATPKSFGKPGGSSSPQVSLTSVHLTEQGTLHPLCPSVVLLCASQLRPRVALRPESQSINP